MIILGVSISVLLVVLIGLFVSRNVHGDSTRFLVAGRSLALPLTAAGLMGQAVDTNATLGNTDLTAQLGFWAGAGLPIGLACCLFLTGLFVAKPMNRMRLLTLPDFYRRRFGRPVEVAAAVLMAVSLCILLAGNLVAGGFLFETFMGTSYSAGVLIIVAVVLLYTATGGMISDAYTAFTQMIITVTAALALFGWVLVTHGITIPDGMGPFDFAQLTSADSGALINWATLLSLAVGDIVALDFMQRIFSAKSPEVARRACFGAALGTLVVGIPFSLVALSSGELLAGVPGDGPVLFRVLEGVTPVGLTILVLSGIVAASCSTANGAVLGTSAVVARNIVGLRWQRRLGERDPLIRATRIAFIPVVGFAILLALRVPQTGILLTLAFDLMLASLVAPFLLGLAWRRGGAVTAGVAMSVGVVVRMGLFVLTPTMYGVPNTILHIPNDLVDASFDGWPTLLAALAGLIAYVLTALTVDRRSFSVREAEVEEPQVKQDLAAERLM